VELLEEPFELALCGSVEDGVEALVLVPGGSEVLDELAAEVVSERDLEGVEGRVEGLGEVDVPEVPGDDGLG